MWRAGLKRMTVCGVRATDLRDWTAAEQTHAGSTQAVRRANSVWLTDRCIGYLRETAVLYRGHLASGAIVGVAVAPAITHNAFELMACVALTTLGSVVPDIDKPRTFITRALGPVGKALHWLVSRVSGPRAMTHSLPGIVAFTALLLAFTRLLHLPDTLALTLGLGCLVHSIGDSPNKKRIQWMWPLKGGWSMMLMRVGGWRDVLTCSAFFVIAAGSSYFYYFR